MTGSKRIFYGWFDVQRSCYRISRDPADAPVRGSIEFDTDVEAEAFVRSRRCAMMWDKNTPLTTKKAQAA